MRHLRSIVALAFVSAAASSLALTLHANPGPASNGGGIGWAIFFDLTAQASPLSVTHMTTASTAAPSEAYTIEVFTRTGSGLGGPVAAGPGSSPAGWTSLGTAPMMQGLEQGGVSLLGDIPDIAVPASTTVGVAVLFTGAAPRYFGTGSPPYGTYFDGFLSLQTGDARSQPFTTGGSWFASRELVGQIDYVVVPEPASILALAGGAALLLLRRQSSTEPTRPDMPTPNVT